MLCPCVFPTVIATCPLTPRPPLCPPLPRRAARRRRAQALGRQVLVFNCDEAFDVAAMARLFVGLLRTGAWGCFDEFNRLEPAVLSAVSQQIQLIQGALHARAPTVALPDVSSPVGSSSPAGALSPAGIPVDPAAGIFVTLNPACKGYGGRSQLPDNLAALFRPVAMAVPDAAAIATASLLSEGFRHEAPLGRTLAALFAAAGQLLSPQRHYDWGLRALKTVLDIAGEPLRSKQHAHPLPPVATDVPLWQC
jgi:dynein heavy chain 2, cytosolic